MSVVKNRIATGFRIGRIVVIEVISSSYSVCCNRDGFIGGGGGGVHPPP